MKSKILSLAFVFSSGIILMQSCGASEEKKEESKDEKKTEESEIPKEKTKEDMIAEGQLLVEQLGCNDCHSTKKMTEMGPVPDEAMLLAGHPETEKLAPYDPKTSQAYLLMNMGMTATVGPWGTSFAANLTPDETGLGNWTFDQFKKAMREGKYKGMDNSRMLLPPMPWPGYAKLNDEQLESIFTYLQSIPAIKNQVPSPILNVPK